MITRFAIWFLSLCAFTVHAQQSFETNISGNLTYDSMEPIPDAQVELIFGNEVISVTLSNASGNFLLNAELLDNTEYRLEINGTSDEFPIHEELTFNTEIYHHDYHFDVSVPVPLVDSNRGQIAYYAKNETKKFEEFEIKQILMIIKKYPNICIQFGQTIVRDESEKTAEKRKIAFLKALEDAGVDMRCIQFDPITRTLQAVNEDQRSRILGAIYSFESRCN